MIHRGLDAPGRAGADARASNRASAPNLGSILPLSSACPRYRASPKIVTFVYKFVSTTAGRGGFLDVQVNGMIVATESRKPAGGSRQERDFHEK